MPHREQNFAPSRKLVPQLVQNLGEDIYYPNKSFNFGFYKCSICGKYVKNVKNRSNQIELVPSLSSLKTQILLLGTSPATYVAARRLTQLRVSNILIEFPFLNEIENKLLLFPIGLQNLENLSIPYKEATFKNKRFISAYIERFLTLQRFHFQRPSFQKYANLQGGVFHRRIPIGLIRLDKLLRFLRVLTKDSKAQILTPSTNDQYSLEISKKSISFSFSSTQISAKQLIVGNNVPPQLLETLGIAKPQSITFLWFYSIHSIVTDSADYFFHPDYMLALYPARSQTIITCHSKYSASQIETIITTLIHDYYKISEPQLDYLYRLPYYTQGLNQSEYPWGFLTGHVIGLQTPFLKEKLLLDLQTGNILAQVIYASYSNTPTANYSIKIAMLATWNTWEYATLQHIFESLTQDELLQVGKILSNQNLDSIQGLGFNLWLRFRLKINKLTRKKSNDIRNFLFSILGTSMWSY